MLIVSPLPMQWEEGYKKVFPGARWVKKPSFGHDSYLFMWCDEVTRDFINLYAKQGTYTVFVRRYEYYSDLESVDWSKVDNIIMVNDYLAKGFEQRTGIKPHVVYNGVDPSKWTYKERTHGKKIAWVGFINQKKNLPLALQIMAELPRDYELHIAGAVQDPQSMDYIDNLARSMQLKIVYNGEIPHEYMDKWLDDKHYILNTAISEGCPNHVIEAMAKGIKPVVHNWPGSFEQFADYVFDTVPQAVESIRERDYDSSQYRFEIENNFGVAQYEKVKEIAWEACTTST